MGGIGMTRGVVSKVVREQGYGFIRSLDCDDREYFFHVSGLADAVQFYVLQEGQLVQFDGDLGPKGLRANRVCLPTTEVD